MINKGFNKLLFDKRLELSLSEKEACKKLGILRVTLHLVENGYITLSKKLKSKFINGYELDPNFFEDDLAYPVMISEDNVKEGSSKIRKITNSKPFKISCGVLAVGFLTLSIFGVVNNINTKNNIAGFYDQNVLAIREQCVIDHDDVEDKGEYKNYTIIDSYLSRDGRNSVSLTMSDNNQQLPYTAFEGNHQSREIVSFYNPNEEILVDSSFSHKCTSGYAKYSVTFKNRLTIIASCTVREKNGEYSYSFVKLNDGNGLKMLENNDPRISEVEELFKKHFTVYQRDLDSLFDNRIGSEIPYISFLNSLTNGNQGFKKQTIANSCMLLLGIIFATLFFALAVLFIFKKVPVVEKIIEDNENREDITLSKEIGSNEKTPLKKNWKIFPLLPGSLIRVASLVLIFISSIGIYLLFNSIINVDVQESLSIIKTNSTFSLFLVVAFILLLFTKNDLVQEKKDYFLTNYFYFFSGLALYLLVMALSTLSVVDTTIRGTIANVIVNVIPGNFLWGFLAFNMVIFLLFYRPVSIADDKKKLLKFRYLALIPYIYLVVSLVLDLLNSCAGVTYPLWLSFLFFTKSTYLIVFLLLFTSFCFIYKLYTVKKYGIENAKLYQKGNKYYFVRNIAAALIILLIGIFEIIAHFCFPDNPGGFGENILILVAVPIVLLYHPHHGKRNKPLDFAITIFYGLAYAIGIALIILSVLIFIIKHF